MNSNVIDLSTLKADHDCPGKCGTKVKESDYTCSEFPTCNPELQMIEVPDMAACYHKLSNDIAKHFGMADPSTETPHLSELPAEIQSLLFESFEQMLRNGFIQPGAIVIDIEG